MGTGTPKTDFYELLRDIIDTLEGNYEDYYGGVDIERLLLPRIRKALQELEEL